MKHLILLFLMMVSVATNATILYVNANHPAANDSNWGDTPESPWLTLNVASWNENDTIMVANGIYTLSARAFVNKNVTVIGQSKAGVIIQGQDDMSYNFNMTTSRFFSIGTGVVANLRNLTIKNMLYDWGNDGDDETNHSYGGAFELTTTSTLNLKNIHIKNIKIYGNGGNAWGGAVMNRGMLNADSTIFENCYATQGGAIYVSPGATANLTNCNFINNGNPEVIDYETFRFGGAICMTGSATVIADKCYFENNHTEKNGWGGVVMVRYDADKKTTLHFTNTTFSNNKSSNAGSVLHCAANTAATVDTELDIAFKNCVFYKNIGNLVNSQFNNTVSLPGKANYTGKGQFVFVNNSLYGNFNPTRTNVRSVYMGDVKMNYYIINNFMNDNETDEGTPQTGTFGFILEGSYNLPPVNVSTMVILGNVFNATGGSFSPINFPHLNNTEHPEMKNLTGQRLIRTQMQITLKQPQVSGVPYIDFTSSADSVSVALNNGVNEYLLGDVNIVPQTDILGNLISDGSRDAGAWEMQATATSLFKMGIKQLIAYPTPFSTDLYFTNNPDQVEIISTDGKSVIKQVHPEGKMDVSALQKGIYLIKTTKDGISGIQQSFKK